MKVEKTLNSFHVSDQLKTTITITMNPIYQSIAEATNGSLCVKDCRWLEQLNLTDQDIQYIMNLTSMMRTSNSKPITDSNLCYCNGTMRNIAIEYRNVHGYVSLFVCIFGTLANSFNIAVLTRKQMKSAPFAYILTWLAITDMLLMTEYIPFALYMYIDSHSKIERFSYGGAIFILIHTHLSQVLHTMSICLTLTLAFWRRNTTRWYSLSFFFIFSQIHILGSSFTILI